MFQTRLRFRCRGGVLEALRLHLTTWTGAGSLTVGPPSPLVRFDQSPASSPSSARVERGSGDHRRRTVAPFGKLRPSVDSGGRGGYSGSRRVIGGGGYRRRRAPRRREASGARWIWGYGGSRSKLSRGMGSREDEEVPGEENGEGEALVVRNGRGRGGGCGCRRWGRKLSWVDWRAGEASLGWPEVASVRE